MKVKTHSTDTGAMPGLPDYLALIKFRLLSLVLVSTCMGFYLSAGPGASLLPLVSALVGVLCVGGGANALNQWAERDVDGLMRRTRGRPLPARRISADSALAFGLVISCAGFFVIGTQVNGLTLLLSVLSWASYLLVYTPMKRRSVLNTWVGAVPGALPAVLGCTAATGSVSGGALLLFAILYVWQMPHFFAISWVYREDYLQGGFRMLSRDDPKGARTALHILIHTLILLPVSLGLFLTGDAGMAYAAVAAASGVVFLWLARAFHRAPGMQAARNVFRYSIVYLPLLFGGIILDRFV